MMNYPLLKKPRLIFLKKGFALYVQRSSFIFLKNELEIQAAPQDQLVQGETNAFVLVRNHKKVCIVYHLISFVFLGHIVYVFGRLQVETLETYTKKLHTSNMNWEREISFINLGSGLGQRL